jgi:hypothetical protein
MQPNLIPFTASVRVFQNLNKSACTLGLTSANIPTSALTTASYTNGLYILEASYHPCASGSAYAAHSVADQLTSLHHRLGHLNFHEIVRMGNKGLLGKEWKDVSSWTLAYVQ